jgi:hypothetical protein
MALYPDHNDTGTPEDSSPNRTYLDYFDKTCGPTDTTCLSFDILSSVQTAQKSVIKCYKYLQQLSGKVNGNETSRAVQKKFVASEMRILSVY